MTIRQLHAHCRHELAAAGLEDAEFDAMTLVLHVFKTSRSELLAYGSTPAHPEKEKKLLTLLAQRLSRRPLQYILGEWEFMGLTLQVGEGVLIPREDTVTAVYALSRLIKKADASSPHGLDLCAGSGAIALGLCTLFPKARLTCVEYSKQAFSYLEKNLHSHPQYDVTAQFADILQAETTGGIPPASLDFIISNPPYIASGELPTLQEEVQHEPALALDGGHDGLLYYRAITSLWLPLIKPGGCIALEIGDTQAAEVCNLLALAGIANLQTFKDLSGLDRCVTGVMPMLE